MRLVEAMEMFNVGADNVCDFIFVFTNQHAEISCSVRRGKGGRRKRGRGEKDDARREMMVRQSSLTHEGETSDLQEELLSSEPSSPHEQGSTQHSSS